MKGEELLDRMVVMDKRPIVAIGVEVEECFLHCAKSFKRAGLQDTDRWADPTALPSMGRALWRQISRVKPLEMSAEKYERDAEARLKQLY